MASSSEAFEKFSTWKKERISLKVTVIESGKMSAVFVARIDAIDSEASIVGIFFDESRTFTQFDVEGAMFSVEKSRVVVTRGDSDWMIFDSGGF